MADGATLTNKKSGSTTEGEASSTVDMRGFASAPAGELPPERISFGIIEDVWAAGAPAAKGPSPLAQRAPRLLAGAALLAAGAATWASLARPGGASSWLLGIAWLLPLGLLAAALVARARLRAAWQRPSPRPPRTKRCSRALVVQRGDVLYESGALPSGAPSLAVLRSAGDFGLTLLTNRARTRLIAAITSSQGTFLVGANVEEDDEGRLDALLADASVLGGDDCALDATGPDGHPVRLPAASFRSFVDALVAMRPGCRGRLLLSDQRGEPLELDGESLVTRGARFDLGRPLEWRPILFQEAFGHAIALYQATWIRQGANEVVLVSLLTPSFFDPPTRDARPAGQAEIDVVALRDQRLMQASASDPPPVEQRVAMDGLFVVAVRAALDRAPRQSSQPSRARHTA